jgi:hypothetical protein
MKAALPGLNCATQPFVVGIPLKVLLAFSSKLVLYMQTKGRKQTWKRSHVVE